MTEHGHDTDAIGAAISAAAQQVHAPDALRARIEAQRPARRRARAARRPLFAGAGLAFAAAAVALLVLPGAGGGTPSVAAAATAALRPASGPAPPEDAGRPTELRAGVQGVRFPQWEYAFRWHASGTRHDDVGGRAVATVFYDGAHGSRIGYAIVSGPALAEPPAQSTVVRAGVRFDVLREGGATIVTWRRAGHTCVLAARGVPATHLVSLAAWRVHGQAG